MILVLSYIELNLRNNIIIAFYIFLYNFLIKRLGTLCYFFNFILKKVIDKIYRRTSDYTLYRLIRVRSMKRANQLLILLSHRLFNLLRILQAVPLNTKSTI